MKRLVYNIDPWEKNVFDAPYYNFLENFQIQISRFQPVNQVTEFNRLLAQPFLMLPIVTEELKDRIPEALQMTHPEDDSQNQVHFIQDMILKRHLIVKFTSYR